ncbi:MAG TPA: biotin synthase BioB [Candidatus Acidoferrales bacterium]|nr:biotin synthase BioB [Candidatus Acidoferrales bacterium]
MKDRFDELTRLALAGELLPRADALAMLAETNLDVLRLAAAAGDVRMAHFGRKVTVHQINNIKNGLCPEDCGYCAQSKVSTAALKKYPTKDEESILAEARDAKQRGVYRYCMVASGRGPTEREAQQLAHILRRIRDEVGIRTCLSVGLVDESTATLFKEAGLDRLNHNLNTSRTHTDKIVGTHTYQDRLNTLCAAKKAGLESCSGMIAGMGESDGDIVDVAYELRGLEVPSIPINFLIPIAGNPLYDFNQLSPLRCLRILCMFRFVNPRAEIRVAGGREGHLRGLQSLALYPANSLFVDGYLATRGDEKSKVYKMIEDAGFEIDGHVGQHSTETAAERYVIDDSANIMNPKTAIVSG